MKRFTLTVVLLLVFASTTFAQGRPGSLGALRTNSPYDTHSISNPYGAGSRFKANGLRNSYSRNGSRFSNQSWRNPYATQAPKLYSGGRYLGRLSANTYRYDSTSNRFGRYGSRYSTDSIKNPYGAGNRYSTRPVYVYPGR